MIPTLEQKLAWLKPVPAPAGDGAPTRPLGLGEFEIGFQRTNDILDEGMEVFVRSCRSAMGIAGDSLVGIFTADGDMVNGSCGTYLHAVIPPGSRGRAVPLRLGETARLEQPFRDQRP